MEQRVVSTSNRYRVDRAYREATIARSKARRAANKAYWITKKGGACIDCGNADERVLQFDHVSAKTCAITRLMPRQDPEHPDLVAEMARCELRCANCHVIKTIERGQRVGAPKKYLTDEKMPPRRPRRGGRPGYKLSMRLSRVTRRAAITSASRP